MNIGFIGLGGMGTPIAANLLRAGHRLWVWNRSRAKVEPLLAQGAVEANTPAAAADEAELVITMLADDIALEAVTFGEEGVLSATAKPVHAALGTIGVATAERLADAYAERGSGFVAAPVFGRPTAAEAAALFIVCAGKQEHVALCQPAFEAIGQRSFSVGERPASASIVKLCGNFMIMSVVESLAEAMTLADRHCVGKADLLEVLTGTLFGAPIYHSYGRMLVEERYRPAGFSAVLGLKDMELVAAAASKARVPMPLLSLLRDRLLSTIAQEGEDIDWAGIAKTIDESAGKAGARSDS